jgi:nucleoid DNA-binding protein
MKHKNMKEQELNKEIANRAGVKENMVDLVMDAFSDVIISTLKQGGKVKVANLGVFSLKKRPEAIYRHVRKDRNIRKPEHHIIQFTAYRKIKKQIDPRVYEFTYV